MIRIVTENTYSKINWKGNHVKDDETLFISYLNSDEGEFLLELEMQQPLPKEQFVKAMNTAIVMIADNERNPIRDSPIISKNTTRDDIRRFLETLISDSLQVDVEIVRLSFVIYIAETEKTINKILEQIQKIVAGLPQPIPKEQFDKVLSIAITMVADIGREPNNPLLSKNTNSDDIRKFLEALFSEGMQMKIEVINASFSAYAQEADAAIKSILDKLQQIRNALA